MNKKYRSGQITKAQTEDAGELFLAARDAYLSHNIPTGMAADLLRSLTTAFECLEYALIIPVEVSKFFVGSLDEFLAGAKWNSESLGHWDDVMQSESENFLHLKLEKLRERFAASADLEKTEDPVKLINEIILIALCGVNCLYRLYEDDRAKENLQKLIPLIYSLSGMKDQDVKSSSTMATAFYFLGKLNFSLGQYKDAEECFKNSSQGYLKKLLLIDGESEDDRSTRALAKRRYALCSVFGLGYLFRRRAVSTNP